MKTCYRIDIEDLTGLGGPMGTERTTTKTLPDAYDTPEKAKAVCVEMFEAPIDWHIVSYGWRSPDLRYVMYHIHRMTIN